MRVYNTIFIASIVILLSLSGVTIISSEIPTASGQTYIIQANNDFATTYQGLPSTIDVLQNDYDPNPSAIMNVVIDSQPLHGSVVYDPNTQLITYTSSQDYFGPDSFTYHVNDGTSISNIAQVSITVIQVVIPNSPPVAVSDTYTTDEQTPIILNVLANDYDPDGDPLTIVSVTGPYHGTISIQQDQTIKYSPEDEYSGQDSFIYTISDGHPHGIITTEKTNVNITVMPVNHHPVAETDYVVTNENTAIKIPVLANDYDPDPGDTISIISVSTPYHGTAVINADKTITYTPALNYIGSDAFTYVISDNHGNSVTVTATVNVIVHGLPSPIITNPSSDLFSNYALQTISGTSYPNVIINLYDGTLLLGTTLADSSGKWSIQTLSLSDGLHVITTKATDSTGTLSAASNIINITIDTINPTITISSPSDGATINTGSFTVSGTASDTNLRQVNVSVDSGLFKPVTGTSSWSTIISGLSNGPHTITASATDNAGNIHTSSIMVIVDLTSTTPPTVTITSPANGATINTATPLITGTAGDATSGLASVQIQIDSGAFNDASGTTSWTFNTASLTDGVHTVTAKATDNIGNTQTTSITITVDTTAPTVTITSPANGAIVGTKIIHVTGTAGDATSGLANIQVKIDSNSYTTASGTTSWTFNTASLTDGIHTINAKATDNIGNTRTTSITIIVQTNNSGKVTSESGSIGGTTNFEFEIQSSNGHTHGNLRYADKLNKIDLQSISITSLSIDHSNTKASFSGTAKVNGHNGYEFNVYVEDNGSGKNDFFSIKIFDSIGHKIYEKSNKLTQGNIKIHKSSDRS